jgi:CHAT domain-containing protein
MQLRSPKILHIATHGFFINDDTVPNPMLKSGIALSGANKSVIRGENDGVVTALKLSGLDLKGTELVVLSACQTGVVDSETTENVSGLSKAFIQAGAIDIVMSLWSVDDNATKELMGSFYKEMQGGEGYAEALRKAKLEMIKKGIHPFFWAPFIISGM